MARKKRKKIKIELTVPEPINRLRMPKSGDTKKLKDAIKKTDVKTALKTDAIKEFIQKNDRLVVASIIVIVAAVSISLVIMSFFFQSQLPAAYVPQKVTRTETVTVEVPVNLSFEEYLDNSIDYGDEEVTVIGFLKNDLRMASGGGVMGIHIYSVVDDYGNEINLTELSVKDKTMFVQRDMTLDLYEVRGKIKLKFREFDLEVTDIQPIERPTTQVVNTVIIEEYL